MARNSLSLCVIESLEHRRLLSAGQLDPSFGTGGKTTINFHGSSVQATAVATQADGKTVIAGLATNGNKGTDAAVVRLNINGSLDTTFGPDHTGIVRIHSGDSSNQTGAEAVMIDGSGNILIAGSDDLFAVGFNSGSFLVARLKPDGTLDSSFGSGGKKVVDFGTFSSGSFATAMAFQNDGKIVVVGQNSPGGLTLRIDEFAAIRLNPDGSRDNSFNGDGTETISFDDDAIPHAVALDYSGTSKTNPNFGTIVIGGNTFNDTSSRFALVRLRPNGDLDQSFHAGGVFFFAPPHTTGANCTALTVQSSGKIVASGYTGAFSSTSPGVSSAVFAMTRLTSNGLLDSTFSSGHTWANVGFGGIDLAESLLVGQDNRLIIGGTINGNQMGFAAFTPNGVLDGTFAPIGRVTVSFDGGGIPQMGMAYGPGHRFVAAGGGKFYTARLFDTGANLVHITTINSSASEVGPTPGTFFVFREERLPVATRVFLNVSGTAVAPTFFAVKNKTNDYSVDGITFPLVALGGSTTPFVDIPANETFVLVTLNPIDRKLGDGNRTAIFSVKTDPSYDVGDPSSVQMTIQDKKAAQTIVHASADALVRDGASANTNFGTSTQLNVKTDAANSGFNRRTFLKFDISSLTNINSVKLQLFGNLSSTASSNVSAGVFAVADTSWSETGITFKNQPTIGANLATATILDTTPRLYTWDITAYVKAQKAAGHNIITLALKNISTTSSFDIFNSREASSNVPQLVVS